MTARKSIIALALLGFVAHTALAQQKAVETKPAQAHIIGAAKLIVGDVKANQSYYEKMFGMKEVSHYTSEGVYDEPIMGFESGARLALFSPKVEAPLKKPQAPVALIYTPDLDGIVKRMEDAKYTVTRLPASQSSTFKIAIARDPSGNAIEMLSRPGKWEVGGSKLIVSDRQKAEDFFVKIFDAKPGQRYKTATYDEVLLNFGEGPFLALFQPLNEQPLPKSQYPVVAIYTTQFDAVLNRVKQAGLGYREVKSSSRIIVAKDPAGNSIEIISGTPATPPAPTKK